jgi:TetR/AcrR family transcriptional regulator, ethionamide resistance regulator
VATTVQRTKRRQQREETRGQILAAAQEFLIERPYRELSVDSLMSRTGHTRTVFYRHFDDIPALMLTLIAEVGGELVEVSEEWRRSTTASPQEARQRLARYVDFYVRNGRLIRAVVEASHHDEHVAEAYNGLVEGFIVLTTTAIEQRVGSGEVAPIDNAPEVARALVWMLNGYLLDRLSRPEPADPEQVLQTVATIWARVLFPTAAAGS